ncbi:rhodanese-like domain-containing protein [Photobacterium sp. WH77]|uniref:Rhodanese-like domain-containing protein n=1 Tax=Photobacterium arenosum TaxID=2774143 RepID=A0ABR9BL33_9GAMM|nr:MULTISPECIES: rhodanese-like domain-containing protein [Photobacterium]MBD8513264.1 rhodanese-like domain-containing protein [Photobacterium arenosum]MBV7262177.1 rhodanese-like domain-containing protein [Photobacterium sp. WH24]MCG2837109.1 rhodanese-like domain-containing protein [Photobacterium sp. WH77]MCG2844741.1 rhodanese-like domain-containing protein [Photobacterium sp. WH80]MDO6580740.1 rhodanese-like domain-containing protein [Photobacterium sp. 2_MG-2023]
MQQFIEFVTSNPILSLVWVGLVLALISSMVKQKTAGYAVVTPNQATVLVNREDGVFVDIRSKDDFQRGHIAGALHILPSEIKAENFGLLEKYKSAPIIVVCKTGQTAQESASLLHKAGYAKVSLLKDGLISWNEANLPLVQGKK